MRLFHMLRKTKYLARNHPILIANAAPSKFVEVELRPLIAAGCSITLNTAGITNADALYSYYGNRLNYVEFDALDEDQLSKIVLRNQAGFSVIKSRINLPFSAELINRFAAPSLTHPLTVLAQVGSGTNNVDCAVATERGVIVTHTPGSNSNAVAEFVFGQILTLSRQFIFYNEHSHRGQWLKDQSQIMTRELRGHTLGLIGIGRIAKAIIPLAQAFGMKVVGWGNANFTINQAKQYGIKKVERLEDLLRTCDVVSLHVPLTEQTKNLMSADKLQYMKQGAFLINTSRGGIVDEQALAYELTRPNRKILAAAIDTFEYEKANYQSPLIGLDNVLLTPHMGGATYESLTASADALSRQIVSLLDGDLSVPIANPLVKENLPDHKLSK